MKKDVIHNFTFFFLLFFVVACKKDEDAGMQCRLTAINPSGLHYALTYEGDNMVSMGTGPVSTRIYYDGLGQIAKMELPLDGPYRRIIYSYGGNGKVSELKVFVKQDMDWIYEGKQSFTYVNNQLSNVQGSDEGMRPVTGGREG